MDCLDVAGRRIGPELSPYIIAEVGANHNGDMVLCRKLIDAAKAAGADAVKFQSWTADSLISKAEYGRNRKYDDAKRHFGSLLEMVERFKLTPEQHREIAAYCTTAGVTFLSTGFSPAEVDLLDDLGVPCFKVASMDVNHLPLLRHVGSKGRPVILSTGMATLGEIERAIDTLRGTGAGSICLLHCLSLYPPDYRLVNLRNIATLKAAFGVPVGFSDHTIGTAIPLAAIVAGACVIEKHFTLDRNLDGWDHWVSATPEELAVIVREGRNIVEAMGSGERRLSAEEWEKRRTFRRRVVLKCGLQAGAVLGWDDLDYKRPGTGIHPDEARFVVGRTLRVDTEDDHELEWTDLA